MGALVVASSLCFSLTVWTQGCRRRDRVLGWVPAAGRRSPCPGLFTLTILALDLGLQLFLRSPLPGNCGIAPVPCASSAAR